MEVLAKKTIIIHQFIHDCNEYSKIFIVKCVKTGGEFSTEMWRLGKEKQNICACCKKQIIGVKK
jgi:hypothetical protein